MTKPRNKLDTQRVVVRATPLGRSRNASACVLAIAMISATVAAEATIPWSSLSSGAGSLAGSTVTLRGSFGPMNSPLTDGKSDTIIPGFWTGVTPGDSGCNPADVNEDGLLDLSDVNLFISSFLTGGSEADLNGDGLYDLFDINQFVSAFLAGCP